MKLSRNILAAAVAALLIAPAAHAEITIDDFWGSEVSFEGLVQADFNWYKQDHWNPDSKAGTGKNQDNTMRRAELVLKGKGPDNNEWVIGYDAASKKWLDVNWKYKFGNNSNHFLQFGQYKQPNSMEELSSTKNNDFIAKANITNAFAIGRRVGLQYNYGDNNWAVTASVFSRELTRYSKMGNGYGLRGYWAPINEKGNILHLGLSYADYDARLGNAARAVNGGTRASASFSVKPNADQAGAIIATGNGTLSPNVIPFADRIRTTGLEAFWVNGPFKLQGEYMLTRVPRTIAALKSYDAKGAYISGVWNVTGETWGYKSGVPTTGLPNEPATGMWQLGLRYDTIDLNSGSVVSGVGGVPYIPADGTVMGGKLNTWTIGANYYWHSNFKFSLNYVMADASKFYTRTPATYASPVAANPWNNRLINGELQDKPRILEARIQFFW